MCLKLTRSVKVEKSSENLSNSDICGFKCTQFSRQKNFFATIVGVNRLRVRISYSCFYELLEQKKIQSFVKPNGLNQDFLYPFTNQFNGVNLIIRK